MERPSLDTIVSLCKRRGFIFPSSELYGGLANSWDYGPLGVELKNNIKSEWWRRFVHARPDMVGLDASLIMNPKVWEASGHLAEFTDPLVECKVCHTRFRADQPDEILAHEHQEFTEPQQFNLMLKTFLGSSESTANTVYFRPETAQAMFVDFKNILATSRKRIPFGIAQMGKAFRNEITPGQFIFRTREFEQMEIEYFVRESDWQQQFEHWLGQMKQWLKDLGVADERLHFVEIPDGERAHYSKRTVDVEYDYPFGQKELYGLAYRADFDLASHAKASGQDLQYVDPETNEKFLPHVIEPTWGVDRSVLVALLEAYHEEEAPTAEEGETDKRVVLKFPYWLAPIKVAVLPLSKKLAEPAQKLLAELSASFVCDYDETQSIGKRYRRQDEVGTPFCVTLDFETEKDSCVTIRERDSMQQERVPIAEVATWIQKKIKGAGQ
jgi:glycyl-tRNA synthetase